MSARNAPGIPIFTNRRWKIHANARGPSPGAQPMAKSSGNGPEAWAMGKAHGQALSNTTIWHQQPPECDSKALPTKIICMTIAQQIFKVT